MHYFSPECNIGNEEMKITILHHHLNPGGVTRIIRSQISSLRKKFPDTQIRVITGKAGNQDFFSRAGVEVLENPDIDYILGEDLSPEHTREYFKRVVHYLKENIDRDSIIHVHNLNLGKNPVLTLALQEMMEDGYRLFNHCHDFAEDRPANIDYMKKIIEDHFDKNPQSVMYPNRAAYHFGTINAFDRDRVIGMGVNPKRVVHLPNPVHFDKQITLGKADAKKDICNQLEIDISKTLITYPVRVIRRKNIGELILLAVIFEGSANWVVTQPPKNPEEIIHYQHWVDFCKTENIPVIFEAGNKVDFEKLLVATDVCISTSLREGFGMVFLEPWLFDTPVMGRNIDYVTKDLIDSGVEFPLLYDEINVEVDDTIKDFGDLDEEQQRKFILDVIQNRPEKRKVQDMNPRLKTIFEPVLEEMIRKNKQTIQQHYSLDNYAIRLNGIYRKMA